MKTGEELTLIATKKEFIRLSKKADKAKKEADEACSVGSEMISIHNEFITIVNEKDYSDCNAKKLELLQKRQYRCKKIIEKDLCKLLDAQTDAEIERDNLLIEIQLLEFRISRYAINCEVTTGDK